MRCMSWELAATLGEGSVQDVKWASSATSPAADILAVAGSHEVVLYELEGAIDRLQVCPPRKLHFGSFYKESFVLVS